MHRNAFAALVIALGVPAAAADKGEVWTRISSPDGRLSVETPCTAGQIEQAKQVPSEVVPGVNLSQASRVICLKDGIALVAGVLENPAAAEETAAPGSAFFDQLMDAAKSDATAEGKATLTSIDGRRAFLDRQESAGVVAQTGLVEIDSANVVFITAGGASASSVSDQAAMIDRFSRSIKVGVK